LAAGVKPEKIILDPGIGFAKTTEGNLALMRRLDELHDLGYPLLLGVSRKGFIGQTLGGLDVTQRLEGTLAATCFAAGKGIQIIRVHDVLENARAVKMMAALESDSEAGILLAQGSELVTLLELISHPTEEFSRSRVLNQLGRFLGTESGKKSLNVLRERLDQEWVKST
jgi:hypothetical protein